MSKLANNPCFDYQMFNLNLRRRVTVVVWGQWDFREICPSYTEISGSDTSADEKRIRQMFDKWRK